MQKGPLKLGIINIDSKQVFWKMQHCYAIVPLLQIHESHVLIIPKRSVASFSDLSSIEVFDIGLTIKLLSRTLQNFYASSASTIHICNSKSQQVQNTRSQDSIQQLMVHIAIRKANDFKHQSQILQLLENYPSRAVQHYKQTVQSDVKAYSAKLFESLNQKARKYESHVNICYKQQQIF